MLNYTMMIYYTHGTDINMEAITLRRQYQIVLEYAISVVGITGVCNISISTRHIQLEAGECYWACLRVQTPTSITNSSIQI